MKPPTLTTPGIARPRLRRPASLAIVTALIGFSILAARRLSLASPPATNQPATISTDTLRTDGNKASQILHQLRDPDSRTVLVSAHRAGWKYAPENSIEGIKKCIDMGVDILEIDLQKTADGHFVLMHDKTLDRTTTGRGPVSNWTVGEIHDVRLRDAHGMPTAERVPTLEQLVSLSRGHILIYLDKTEDRIDEVYARLKDLDAVDFSLFYGLRNDHDLRSRYGSIMDSISYLPKIYDDTPDLSQYIADLGRDIHPAAFVIEFKTHDSSVLKAIPEMRAAHARVWASPLWPQAVAGHIDDLALKDPDHNWGWMIGLGVNIFCTDRPKEMLSYLRAKGLHE